jgi:hypothetical protein
MKKVKALQTIAGTYGRKSPEDEPFEVTDSIAKSLEEKGLVKIVGAAGADPEEEVTHTSVTYGAADEKNKNAGPNPVVKKAAKKK